MTLPGILPFARFLLEQALHSGDIAIDCTAGNGHDSLFLAKLVGETGHVYSLDIQEKAVEQTKRRLNEHQLSDRATVLVRGHEEVEAVIPSEHLSRVKAAIFNLGYLPGGNKSIVTRPDSTIRALRSLLSILPSGGLIILVIYHGHEEGKRERDALLSFTETLEQSKVQVLNYQFINQINHPPFLLALEKK